MIESDKIQIASLLMALDSERRLRRKSSARLSAAEKRLRNLSIAAIFGGLLKKIKKRAVQLFSRKRIKSIPGCSIIIPTWRPNPYLTTAVESCLNQTVSKQGIEIIVCVNGGNRDYFEQIKCQYRGIAQVKVLYADAADPNVARRIGVEAARMPLLTFLDDDDMLSPGFVGALAGSFARKDINIAIGRMVGCDEKANVIEAQDNAYLATMRRVGEGPNSNYRELSTCFSTFWAKMYRTSFFRGSLKISDSLLPFAEDVFFWVENYPAISGLVWCDRWDGREAYIRCHRPDSRSKSFADGDMLNELKIRLKAIGWLSDMALDSTRSLDQRCFTVSKIKAQEKMLFIYLETLGDEERHNANSEIAAAQNPFLELFQNQTGER